MTDENGELKAETAYYNGEGADTDAAAFVNLYTASATYGTGAELIVEKTLSGAFSTTLNTYVPGRLNSILSKSNVAA